MKEAHHCDTYEQLLDRAETLNQEYVEPMQQAEVAKIAKERMGDIPSGAITDLVGMARSLLSMRLIDWWTIRTRYRF